MNDDKFLAELQRRDANAPVTQTGVVMAAGAYDLTITKSVGGTEELPAGNYRVGVVRGFYDYETGMRMVGRLLEPADIARAREVGMVGQAPASKREFHPELVYFHSSAFSPDGPEVRAL